MLLVISKVLIFQLGHAILHGDIGRDRTTEMLSKFSQKLYSSLRNSAVPISSGGRVDVTSGAASHSDMWESM